jgi:hypothetical protein
MELALVPESGPSLSKRVFFQAWPLVADWIRADRNKGNRRIVSKMCKRQEKHLLQTPFWRMRLYVKAHSQGIGHGNALDPEDPYRGWDSFFETYHAEGPKTEQEEWLVHSLWEEYTKNSDRIAEQKDLIQQYKDDMWDESDSSLDSSINVGIVSRDGSCSSFTDTDEEPFWDFNWWLFNRESVPRSPDRDRAHHGYWARWRAQRRAEVRRAEEQAGVHWTQVPSPNEDVPLPVSESTGQNRAFNIDAFLSLPRYVDLALPSPSEEVLLPVSDRTPGPDTHGRAFSSDEDGDGPCVPIQHLTRYFRSCFGKKDEKENDLMVMQALHERADVPPACEICHTPCRLYASCSFCGQSPVMHHGRCCWSNPGRRRREAEKAAAADEEWL